MSEDKAMIVSESVQLGTVQAASPEDIVNRASSVATVLAKVINEKKLYAVINKKKYVQVDGWATLGAMLGVLPRETKSEKLDNGYLAFVELVRTTDGMIIGGASAICTEEERNWSGRDEYAIKSMATTRATGKAYRLAFSWIMNLAGYESTPAEEMIEAEFTEKKSLPTKEEVKPKRPYSAEAVRTGVQERAHGKYKNTSISEKRKEKVGLMVGMLNECFAGEGDTDAKRHELCQYLTGFGSSKDMPDNFVLSMLDWMSATKDSGGAYIVPEYMFSPRTWGCTEVNIALAAYSNAFSPRTWGCTRGK